MPNYVVNKLTFKGSDERVAELLEKIRCKNDDFDCSLGTFDFNNVIPMPKFLNIESSSRNRDGVELYLTAINPDSHTYDSDLFNKVSRKELEDITNKLNREHNDGLPGSLHRSYSKALTKKQLKELEEYCDLEELLKKGAQACENVLTYGYMDWYKWCVNKWGTKWNAMEAELISSNEIYFQTAWSMPYGVIIELSAQFPDVEITVKWADEDLGCNCGTIVFLSGRLEEEDIFSEYSDESLKFACDVWDYDYEEIMAEREEYDDK